MSDMKMKSPSCLLKVACRWVSPAAMGVTPPEPARRRWLRPRRRRLATGAVALAERKVGLIEW